MSMLLETIYRYEATSTHHRLALDALRHLRGKSAEGWRRLFVRYYEDYFDGATAPDRRFRDFRNHVLYIGDNDWGGAVTSSIKWYERTVEALRKRQWPEAVFCAGVLSHYYTDPFQPLHTGHAEQAGHVHQAVERSVFHCYDQILALVKDSDAGFPQMEAPAGPDWLAQMVRQGATQSHAHYQALAGGYDLRRGAGQPAVGLNDDLRRRLSALLGHAIVGLSRILEQAFRESQARPPSVRIFMLGLLTRLTSPFGKLGQFRAARRSRRQIVRIHRELKRTGCVIDSLPAEERDVRRLYAEEVLGISLERLNEKTREAAASRVEEPARDQPTAAVADSKPTPATPSLPPTTATDRGIQADPAPAPSSPQPAAAAQAEPLRSSPEYHLDRQSPLSKAPSIGSKTVRRLAKIGVQCVDDLLGLDPLKAAGQLDSQHITARTIRNWQSQAALMCRIPGLRGHEAQMLVGSGLTDPHLICQMSAESLLDRVETFLISEEGERILRVAREPDQAEVQRWIAAAQQARKLRAA